MKLNKTKKYGFTLVEIMIVVAIIGLLAAIAIPNFVRARTTSQMNACINNLRQIDGAKQQWALENKVTGAATPRGHRHPALPGTRHQRHGSDLPGGFEPDVCHELHHQRLRRPLRPATLSPVRTFCPEKRVSLPKRLWKHLQSLFFRLPSCPGRPGQLAPGGKYLVSKPRRTG